MRSRSRGSQPTEKSLGERAPIVPMLVWPRWTGQNRPFRRRANPAISADQAGGYALERCFVVNGQGLHVLPRKLPVGSYQIPLSGYQGLISRAWMRRSRQLRKHTPRRG